MENLLYRGLTAILAIASMVYAVIVFVETFRKTPMSDDLQEPVDNHEDGSQHTNGRSDIEQILFQNYKESTEYYLINKGQAKTAYHLALAFSLLGFFVFFACVTEVVFLGMSVTVLQLVTGGVIEIVSSLFLFLFTKTNAELRVYHERLGRLGYALLAMEMFDRMPKESQERQSDRVLSALMACAAEQADSAKAAG